MNIGRARELGLAALAGTLLLVACGGDEQEAARRATPALRGAALVAGSTVQSWGLLVIPREGGSAELRALGDPSHVLWSGGARIPASVEAHALEGGVAVLRAPDGTVHRYDPAGDRVSEVGRVGDGASWIGYGGAGVWTDPVLSSVLVVTTGDAWRVTVPERPVWAAPLGEGRVVALVGTPEAARPLVLERAAGAPAAASGPGDGAGSVAEDVGGGGSAPRLATPALVTAWGRRLAATGPDGRSLVLLTLPELASSSEIELDAQITALSASPSSHVVYAAVGTGPTRLVAIGRLDGREERLGRLDGRVQEIRPSLFGGSLLLVSGGSAAFLPLSGGGPVRLPGAWRPDLPLGLPDDRALVATEEGVALWSEGAGGESAPTRIGTEGDAWWLAVRWRPPRLERLVESEEEPGAEAAGERTLTAAEAGAEGMWTEETPAEGDPERPPGAAGEREAPAAGQAPTPPVAAAVRAGFYAIVASAQQPDEIVSLTRRLGDAGFRSGVQRHRDEASEIWYRALVGPYATREEAEAAARQLRRERGLQAWIAEVGPDARPDDASP